MLRFDFDHQEIWIIQPLTTWDKATFILKVVNTANSQEACNFLHYICKVLEFFLSLAMSKGELICLWGESMVWIKHKYYLKLIISGDNDTYDDIISGNFLQCFISFPLPLYWEFEPDPSILIYIKYKSKFVPYKWKKCSTGSKFPLG